MELIGFYSCFILAIIFGILGFIFMMLKDKGAILVSGFNSFSKNEQALYDKAKIVYDMRNSCFIWAFIMFLGAIFSYFIGNYMAIIAYIVWFILFIKDVHLDNHKAFEKYLIK